MSLEEWVGFKWSDCNTTNHGKKVEIDEHDTGSEQADQSVWSGENMLRKGRELSLIT